MTKEQEKAIKVLEQYKRECIEEYKVELDDKDNIDQPRAFYLHQQIESVYIVLNMLKEKDAEIEKKDKIIDLMAKELQKHIFVLYDGDTITSKKGIIEHYKRKVEK